MCVLMTNTLKLSITFLQFKTTTKHCSQSASGWLQNKRFITIHFGNAAESHKSKFMLTSDFLNDKNMLKLSTTILELNQASKHCQSVRKYFWLIKSVIYFWFATCCYPTSIQYSEYIILLLCKIMKCLLLNKNSKSWLLLIL